MGEGRNGVALSDISGGKRVFLCPDPHMLLCKKVSGIFQAISGLKRT